ncbi:MAG: methyl-accepting chemotaxis protein [Thermodesulfobacteriota bacterium]|nr:methyl-accepting chemotaxis protein [Thermodesulfobacteriota bacterium]
MSWRSLSISNKIWLSLSILILGYFLSTMYIYSFGKKTQRSLTHVSESVFPATRESQTALNAFKQQVKLYKDAVMMGDTQLLDTAREISERVTASLNTILGLEGLSDEITGRIRQIMTGTQAFTDGADEAYRAMATGGTPDMNRIQQLAAQNKSLTADLEALTQTFADNLKTDLTGVSNDTQKQSNYSLIAFFAIVIASVIIIWRIISRSIIHPLKHTVEALREIRRGNLSHRLDTGGDEIGVMRGELNAVVESLSEKAATASEIANGNLDVTVAINSEEDELGKALEAMVNSLNEIVAGLLEAAAQVDMSSRHVADSSHSLSQGASEQAASVEETSASMTQIGSQSKTNAENATQANQLAGTANEAATTGVTRMEEMVGAMDRISDASNEINKIIKAIDEIAFQTNLLALNAAVEAARAGKHGKGFAVVAQEVRSLAARSAKAVAETSALIETTVAKVNEGSEIVSRTAEALTHINENVAKVTDLVGEIAAASNEQAQGIHQGSDGLTQIDSATQQNSATAEETSAAAGELSSQAAYVRELVSRFTLKAGYRRQQAPKNRDGSAPPKPEPVETKKPAALPFSETPKPPETSSSQEEMPSGESDSWRQQIILDDDEEWGS